MELPHPSLGVRVVFVALPVALVLALLREKFSSRRAIALGSTFRVTEESKRRLMQFEVVHLRDARTHLERIRCGKEKVYRGVHV